MTAAAARARSTGTIRVAVVDPDHLRREGLASIAGRGSGLEVTAQVATVDELPRLAARSVALVALDSGPSSRLQKLPAVPTVAYGATFTDAQALNTFQAGAKGVLVTPCSACEVEHVVRAVAGGGIFIDPHLAGRIVLMATRGRPGEGPFALTSQERRVLALLPQELSNREIGKALGLSHETVKTHLHNAYTKLGVDNRHQAARIVRNQDLDVF